MIVLRSTMEAAVAAAREAGRADVLNLAHHYGKALDRVTALQTTMSAWVRNDPGDISPKQMAQMFYAQDDRWQAEFFNCMQNMVEAHHDSLPAPRAGEFRNHPGVPAGEGQWWFMAQHLDDSGRETIAAMHDHATYRSDETEVAA